MPVPLSTVRALLLPALLLAATLLVCGCSAPASPRHFTIEGLGFWEVSVPDAFRLEHAEGHLVIVEKQKGYYLVRDVRRYDPEKFNAGSVRKGKNLDVWGYGLGRREPGQEILLVDMDARIAFPFFEQYSACEKDLAWRYNPDLSATGREYAEGSYNPGVSKLVDLADGFKTAYLLDTLEIAKILKGANIKNAIISHEIDVRKRRSEEIRTGRLADPGTGRSLR